MIGLQHDFKVPSVCQGVPKWHIGSILCYMMNSKLKMSPRICHYVLFIFPMRDFILADTCGNIQNFGCIGEVALFIWNGDARTKFQIMATVAQSPTLIKHEFICLTNIHLKSRGLIALITGILSLRVVDEDTMNRAHRIKAG